MKSVGQSSSAAGIAMMSFIMSISTFPLSFTLCFPDLLEVASSLKLAQYFPSVSFQKYINITGMSYFHGSETTNKDTK